MSQAVALVARERFLTKASLHLQEKSETQAGECRHDASRLRKSANIAGPKDDQSGCSSCGSLDLQQQQVVQRRGKRSREVVPITDEDSRLLVAKCQRCLRTTKRRLREDRTQSINNSRLNTEVKQNSNLGRGPGVSQDPPHRPSSKKRAKDRKTREGLQAILEKTKEQPPKPASFGLLDFMSKPTRP